MVSAFLAQAVNLETVRTASSGGVFETLAHVVLNRGGAVVGAAFDEDMVLRHRIVERVQDLPPLLKSKYVRSDFASVLPEVAKILDAQREVLFVGTPCSIAAVRKYCKESVYLITVDLLCHGTPPPKYFDAWLQELEQLHGARVVKYDWRCKDHGWAPLETRVDFENGKVIHKRMDGYFFAFLNNFSIGESCLKCPYSKPGRMGDLTLGDAWGLLDAWGGENDNRGISLVLTNTAIGEALLQASKEALRLCVIPPEKAYLRQPEIFLGEPLVCHAERILFKEAFEKTHSITNALEEATQNVRTRAQAEIKMLKQEMKQSRWKSILPFLGKKIRRRKKTIKKKIAYLEQVLATNWKV